MHIVTSRESMPWLILFTLLLSSSQSIVSAENIDSNHPPIIDFNMQDGQVITGESTFTVSIEDEIVPNTVNWRITGFSETIAFSDVTESLFFEEFEGFRDLWSFSTVIGPSIYPSCSCVFELEIEDHTGEIYYIHRTIFIGEDIGDMPASIFMFGDQQWASKNLQITGISKSLDETSISLLYLLDSSPSIRCAVNTEGTFIESEYIFPEEILWTESQFSFELEISNLDDGWYDLRTLSRVIPDSFTGQVASALYSEHCISIRVDNTPPEVIIDGTSELIEGNSKIEYSGASSYDDVWGISGLTYVWSLNQVIDNNSRVIEIISDSNDRVVLFDRTNAGVFQVCLTVIDKAGNTASSNLSVEVNNTPPIVRLQINSIFFTDGEAVQLEKTDKLLIDASLSSDTDNDINSLRYIWRVNNIPMYVGSSTDLSWPSEIEDEFLLTIEVLDDDSASSKLSIYVQDPDSGSSLPLPIILLLASALFFGYSLMRFRVNTAESEIPKW
ncbi:MAG: hypothetical protein CMB61_01330 [Euryarchaeota archaeon]|nr:hypothetical protein [Euryarchaeota archaeon]